jgi:hypothetical protein
VVVEIDPEQSFKPALISVRFNHKRSVVLRNAKEHVRTALEYIAIDM